MSVFNFLSGLGLIAASQIAGVIQDRDLRAQNHEWESHNYSPYIQEEYDLNDSRLFEVFDLRKMMDAIRKDYPGLSENMAYCVAQQSAAKRLMEEETSFEYEIRDNVKWLKIDIDKYSTDNFKREVLI